MISEQVIEQARGLIGVPYRHQGRDRQGMDCVGVYVYIARQLGLPVDDRSGYGMVPDGKTLLEAIEAQPCLERVYEYEPGALLLMRMTNSPQHGAIYCGDTIVHAYNNVGRVVEHRFADVWRARVMAIYGWRP